MIKFIFDVDGTLTPSRQKINSEFEEWFFDFAVGNHVYLVTGSDYSKTLEQLGSNICNSVKTIFNCSGNEIWQNGECTFKSDWMLPEDVDKWLNEKLISSTFPLRTGNHIEHRSGCVNFSVVGRNATLGERNLYKNWDSEHDERNRIAIEFNHTFTKLEARIGGETGIDIYPKGCDKSQILHHFKKTDKLYFFGDRCEPGGNDYPLSKEIKNSFHVKDWRNTWEILQNFKEAKVAA
jgi:phosphomannomutase